MSSARTSSLALILLALASPWSAGCRDCFSEKFPGSCTVETGTGETDDTSDPTIVAYAILEQYCYNCHGLEGTIEGGMNYILDRDKLIANGKLEAGDATGSRIYQRMADGTMPPAGIEGPSEEEIATIKKWIDDGAAVLKECAPGREDTFITNDELFKMAYDDISTFDEDEQKFIRYISFAHLYNSDVCDDELDTYRVGLSKSVNHISWSAKVSPPVAVGFANEGTETEQSILYRVDLRDYHWEADGEDPFDAWEYVVSENPYAFNYGDVDSSFNSLRNATRSRLPIAHVDWFVKVASGPPLYHEMLDVPADLNSWLAKFGVDAEANIENLNVERAGFKLSGVSFYNRLLERHESNYGYCWVSYDFAGDEANDNKALCNNPIDPEYDGGEMICSLPNHMQAYYLANAIGERIDVGPSAVVNDPNRAYTNDLTSLVVNGISCNNCHYAGIIPKADIIAGDDGCAQDSIEDREDLALMDLIYAENGDEPGQLGYIQKADSEYFLAAMDLAAVPRTVENIDDDLEAVEGGDGDGYLVNGEPVFALVREFDGAVDSKRAFAELGLKEDAYDLNDFPTHIKNALEDFDSGNTISRDEFLSVAKELICFLETGEDDGAINDGTSPCDEANACGASGLACFSGQVCIPQTYEFINPNIGELVGGVVVNANTANDFAFGLCATCPSDGSELEGFEDCSDGVDNDCDDLADSADSDCP